MGRETEDGDQGSLPPREDSDALTIIGLGGSAGSIPAMEAFLANVRPDSGSAYVIVLHLQPGRESYLAEILGRATTMPVRQVTEAVQLAPDHVYVIPPGKHLEAVDGLLHLSVPDAADVRRSAIDTFFRTLADTYGPQAAAVVLSGTGADGTLGIRQIKEMGGLAVAQSPVEAEFDAMPRSAIATGMIDYVLPTADMPAQIAAYWRTSHRMRLPREAAPSPEQRLEGTEQEAALAEILLHVRAQTGHDFGLYKRATVLRRIGRRMQVNAHETLPSYRDFVRSHPAEVDDLISDLLISVTHFFRDPEAWETLAQEVVPYLFERKSTNDEVRAWVCGCATGEEAYSLAILLLEFAERLAQPPRVQVFSTDMNGGAVARARIGIYPETILGDISEERLRRWFLRQNGTYQIRKEVRESVLFAHHDLLRDTPFSRLDLVTCRNLLIYLNRDAQERAFATFHFALRPDGRLFLGPSESADSADGLFSTTNKAHRLYVRRSVVRPLPPLPAVAMLSADASAIVRGPMTGYRSDVPAVRPQAELPLARPPAYAVPLPRPASPESRGRELFRNLVERFGSPMALVNRDQEIVHLAAGCARFLRMAEGAPTFNLLQLVHADLRMDLRAALYAAGTEGREQSRLVFGGPALATALGRRDEETGVTVRLTVRPTGETAPEEVRGLFLVQFEEIELPTQPGSGGLADSAELTQIRAAAEASAEVARRMEEENATLQRQLRATVEQYEAMTEELKASNEELQATNEEMRSVAEELETGKEELQSVNEELSTVNNELKVRVEEVTIANSDLQNFLGSTDIGTLFLDRALRIKRYTPAAELLFNLIPTDIGRPLAHLTNRLAYPALAEDAAAVLQRLVPVEREVTSADGLRHYLVRLLPYRSEDDRIEGVVLTFVDITERRKAEEALRASENRYRSLYESMDQGVQMTELVRDEAGQVVDARLLQVNPAWEKILGLSPETVLGRRISEWFPDLEPLWFEVWERVVRTGRAERLEHPVGRLNRWFDAFISPMGGDRFLFLFTDSTERRRQEAALRESEARQAFLVRLGDTLRPLSDPAEIGYQASRLLGEHLRASHVGYTKDRGESRTISGGRYYVESVSAIEDASLFDEYDPTLLPDFRAGRTVVRSDIANDPSLTEAEKDGFVAFGVGSTVHVPLMKEGRPTAVLFVHDRGPREWTASEVALMEETAERIRAAVERAIAENVVRDSEAHLQMIANLMPGLLWSTDPQGEPEWYNQEWLEYTGQTSEEAVRFGWLEAIHPEDRKKSLNSFRMTTESYETAWQEHRIRSAAGEYRWFLVRARPLRNDRGEVVRWFGTATDIEDLKRAQAAQRETEERFRLMVEGATDYAMVLHDPFGTITFWSTGAERLFGWTEAEVLGRDGGIIFLPEDREDGIPEQERRTAAVEGRAIDRRWHIRKDGSRLWADGLLMRLEDESGGIRGYAKVTRDATEQKKSEEALQEALEAVAAANEALEERVQKRTRELSLRTEQLAEMSQMRQELLRQVVTAQEQERARIARDLHDDTGQVIAALLLGLNQWKHRVDGGQNPSVGDLPTKLIGLADEVARKSHRLAFTLRPTALDDLGLMDALTNYAEAWSAWAELPVEVEGIGLDGASGARVRLAPEIETTIYRVVQEALTNILRHAAGRGATRVTVIVQRRQDDVTAMVEDDGPGFDVEATLNQPPGQRRLGIFGMQERAGLAGGTLSIESAPGEGTTVYLRIPLAPVP
ncbi:MAG: PAS domain S-box protein [Capsulimonadales bacterium]|nr:PAS domain S-box protein [Capsulimonadales bacterium]